MPHGIGSLPIMSIFAGINPKSLLANSIRFMIFLYVFITILLASVAATYILVRFINYSFPHLLYVGDENRANPVRNALEMLFFFVSIIVLPTGLFALLVARHHSKIASEHARQVESTRLGSVYMTVVDAWDSQQMVNSRKLMLDLSKQYAVDQAGERGKQGLICLGKHLYDLGQHDLLKFREYNVTLQFFENIGILCQRQYILESDVFEIFGGHIIHLTELFMPYIKLEREAVGNAEEAKTLYANALYLYKAAMAQKPRFHREDIPT
jgi:hypothetical protein